jgi:hypothetical protein
MTFSRLAQVLLFAWLIQSPLVIQSFNLKQLKAKRMTSSVDLTSCAPQIAACSPLQQIVLAILLDIDVTLDLASFGFSQAVIDILRGCPKSEWTNIAVSLHLTAVVDIALKLKVIGGVYGLLFNVLGSVSPTVINACASVFAHLSASSPTLSAILDVRANAQLSAIFARYGCTNTPAVVNLCLAVQLSIFFDPAFLTVCGTLFADLAVTLNSTVIPAITNCLVSISATINIVFLVVSAKVSIAAGVAFACVADILAIVSPSCPCLTNPSIFTALSPGCATCPVYSIPFPQLQPAACIFNLISLC